RESGCLPDDSHRPPHARRVGRGDELLPVATPVFTKSEPTRKRGSGSEFTVMATPPAPRRGRQWASRSCAHLRLRPLQVEPHVHVAVHRGCGSEMLLRLLALARAPIELAEAEVAVGDEGAHAAWLGEGQRLAVVDLAA